jgi:AI-2 transport protein TqsA
MFSLPAAGRIGLYVLLLLVGVIALHLAEPVIVPLLVALLLATVLGPSAAWLHDRLKIRWALACVTVIFGLIMANTLLFFVFSASVTRLVTRMSNEEKIIDMYKKLRNNLEKVSPVHLDEEIFPRDPKNEAELIDYYKKLRSRVEKESNTTLDEEKYPRDPRSNGTTVEKYDMLRAEYGKFLKEPTDDREFPKTLQSVREIKLFKYLEDAAPYLLGKVSLYSANWAWQVVLVLFTTFFVLLEGRMLVRRVIAIFGPTVEMQTRAKDVLSEMAEQVRTYLVWRTIINLGLALVLGVFFHWIGLSQAWTWAILLAILNYIPYFGPVLASIPPFLDAFISTEHPVVPFVIMFVYWVVIVIEGWLIVPLLMGRSMDLNATTVMLACLFWPLVWGPTGLFLAMPLMAALKAILHSVPDLRPWADLMSSAEGDIEVKHPLPLDGLDAPINDDTIVLEPSSAEPGRKV